MKYKILKSERDYSEVTTVEYGSSYKNEATIDLTNGVANIVFIDTLVNLSDLIELVELAKEIQEAHLHTWNALKDTTS